MPTTAERLTEATVRRAQYCAAEAAILLSGGAYSIGNRSLTRADLAEVREAITDLTGEITALTSGNTLPVYRVVPSDY